MGLGDVGYRWFLDAGMVHGVQLRNGRGRARALFLCQYEHPAIVCWRERRRAPTRDRAPDL